ncbi:hypothetical protein CO172_02355 [Candidatus Uhrbacteria bacterium CG_4_9_14_3_um_filter_36_7]|uniref:HTH cro/C1-type domain-containing protein n=1 Tax=Candidatus Uhrbacteria bacterium CG_4_9_14_3_um_filter_36_7 TaxID=1975033 RepID=A0A2M7XHA2_9BACT|nr:MAG: hypothetical protein CO172_02355 [Candidatus Uhrbacteria bacterium CG_4_9_14_3_um_filter_36_7]
MTFTLRTIQKNETLGTVLQTMRRNLHLSIQEASERTKIQPSYLKALERGNYGDLPEPLYIRHFLTTYARVLHTDPSYLISYYEHERKTCDFVGTLHLPRQKIEKKKFLLFHHLWKILLVGGLTFSLLFYFGGQIKNLLHPPTITIFEPTDGFITNDATVVVRGKAEKETNILVNMVPVLPDQNGFFYSEVILTHGTNVITIEGSQKYSKSATLHRYVIFESIKHGEITQSENLWINP